MNHPLQAFLSHYHLDRMWSNYQKAVADGTIPNLRSLGLPELGRHKWLGFTNLPKLKGGVDPQPVKKLLELWRKIQGKDAAAMQKDFTQSSFPAMERQIFDLCMALLHATKTARVTEMRELLEAGVPVNFQHPVTKQSALHIAAGCASKSVVDLLVATQRCNFLLRDQYERIPWNMAHFFNPDSSIEKLLLKMTKEQAQRKSVNLLTEHKEQLRKWTHQEWYYAALRIKYDESGIYQPTIGNDFS